MRPRVIELIDSFRVGGSERQAVQISRLLSFRRNFDVHVACLNNMGPLRSQIDELELAEVPEYRLSNFYDLNAMAQMRRFAAYLKRLRIDIIHTHDFYTNIFGTISAAIAGVPVRISSRRESSKRRIDKRFVERIAYSLSHQVIANCDDVRRQLLNEGVSERKVSTIYNGLDPDLFRIFPGFDRVELLEHFKLPTDGAKRFVTIVANVRPVKDHTTFLRAAQQVQSAVPGACFVIAGEGDLVDSMRSLASRLGIESSTFFLGRCQKVAELLALSNVCVLSSISEGFSNSILEYMAASRPVVATDVGGAREAVIEGETGFLVCAGDHQSMAKQITSLLVNAGQAMEMGRKGRRVVEDKFSCNRQVERVEGLYQWLFESTGHYKEKMMTGNKVQTSEHI